MDSVAVDMSRYSHLRANRGFVLVVVIWLSSILSAVAASIAVTARSHALYERNMISGVLAKGVADGLLRVMALSITTESRRYSPKGEWQACSWSEGAKVWISIQDQSGLVDLNTASPQLIEALLAGLGLSPTEAALTAASIRDYRDADHIASDGGMEPATYPGRPFGPKNAPFEAVEELDQIPGLSPVVLGRLMSLTTVSNYQTGIDLGTAPEDLLQLLGLDRSSSGNLSFTSPRTSVVTGLVVAVELKDASRFVRRALVENTEQPNRPFVITAWETSSWPNSLPAAALSDCYESLASL